MNKNAELPEMKSRAQQVGRRSPFRRFREDGNPKRTLAPSQRKSASSRMADGRKPAPRAGSRCSLLHRRASRQRRVTFYACLRRDGPLHRHGDLVRLGAPFGGFAEFAGIKCSRTIVGKPRRGPSRRGNNEQPFALSRTTAIRGNLFNAGGYTFTPVFSGSPVRRRPKSPRAACVPAPAAWRGNRISGRTCP